MERNMNENEGQTENTVSVAATTQPEANGNAVKTFTQEDVNRIVSDRLAKERMKQTTQQTEESAQVVEQISQREQAASDREAALAARENRLSCVEYIKSKGLDENLMDIFDTSDSHEFQKKVEQLLELYPHIDPARYAKMPRFSAPASGRGIIGASDPIAQAFRGK